MFGSEYLLIPGPTPVPERITRVMQQPMINHRGPAFHQMYAEIVEGVKKIYQTEKGKVVIYPSSGTGTMEAAIANFVCPSEKVLAVSIGAFGDRLAEIAAAFGADVEKMDFPWGEAADPEKIRERLKMDTKHEIKAILVTHNETSTGVYNDIEKISATRENHPALLIVDGVSSLAALELKMDAWNLDVVLSGSQKAFMLPPGLGLMAFSEKAYEAYQRNTNSRYYWDIGRSLKFQEKGETPSTPPVTIYFGLQEALKMLEEEGLENVIRRHAGYRDLIRGGVQAMGLENVAADACASPVVTTIRVPQGHTPAEIRNRMREDFNMVVSGGQGKLADTTFRIGHLGYMREMDLLSCIAALEMTLKRLGIPVELGAGVKKAQEILLAR